MNSLFRHSRRQLSSALTVVMLATAFAVLLPARADARSAHCKAPCPHCQASGAMTCCDSDRSEPSSLPLQTSTTASAGHHSIAVPAFAATTADVAAAITSPALLLLGPPHGYRSTDLRTLNSVLLI